MADYPVTEYSENLRQSAADELGAGLKNLADDLAARGLQAKREPYGRGVVKLRSPRGFLVDSRFPQLLLPDGRLWYYHSRLDPRGIYYDARVDHVRSIQSGIRLAGMQFSFLGGFIRPYHFGYVRRDDPDGSLNFEVGALVGKLDSARYVPIGEALAAIAAKI